MRSDPFVHRILGGLLEGHDRLCELRLVKAVTGRVFGHGLPTLLLGELLPGSGGAFAQKRQDPETDSGVLGRRLAAGVWRSRRGACLLQDRGGLVAPALDEIAGQVPDGEVAQALGHLLRGSGVQAAVDDLVAALRGDHDVGAVFARL